MSTTREELEGFIEANTKPAKYRPAKLREKFSFRVVEDALALRNIVEAIGKIEETPEVCPAIIDGRGRIIEEAVPNPIAAGENKMLGRINTIIKEGGGG